MRDPNAARQGEFELPIRVTLVGPPSGVQFCVQGRDHELFEGKRATGEDLSFDLVIRAEPGANGKPPRFLGPFTHGPPAKRFVYICVGTSAGQLESCWTRRAKIPLWDITSALIEQACQTPGTRLEARVKGTAKDGGPVCASVSLLDAAGD